MTRTITLTIETTEAVEVQLQSMAAAAGTSPEEAAPVLLNWMYQACTHNPAMGFCDSTKSNV